MRGALEPGRLELVCRQRRCHSPVTRHRALALFADDRDDDAVSSQRDRAEHSHTEAGELARGKRRRRIVASLADEPGLGAERRRPGCDVRGLASGAGSRHRRLVVAGDERVIEPDDHVQEQVAESRHPHEYDRRMDGDSRRNRIRSFAIGSLVGAAGAIATVRRSSRRARHTRSTPGGLEAFEDAPCFLELVGEEAQRYREGGETVAGTSNPT